jgi:hypothetical protein
MLEKLPSEPLAGFDEQDNLLLIVVGDGERVGLDAG